MPRITLAAGHKSGTWEMSDLRWRSQISRPRQLKAATLPWTSATTISTSPSPLMSATAGCAWISAIWMGHPSRGAPLQSSTYRKPCAAAVTQRQRSAGAMRRGSLV